MAAPKRGDDAVSCRSPALSPSDPTRCSTALSRASGDHSVNEQHDHRSDDRHDEASGFTRPVETQAAPDPATHKCANNAEYRGQNYTARIPTGHHELRDHTDDESEYEPDDAVH